MTTEIDMFSRGVNAAEELIRNVYRVDIAKVLDPTNPKDFVTLSRRLRSAILREVGPIERDTFLRVVEKLDVDWPSLPKLIRNRLILDAVESIALVPGQILPQVNRLFEVHGTRLVKGTRRNIRRQFGLEISASLTAQDEASVALVRKIQTNFIRDEYGRRRIAASVLARETVANGLERGLGADAISASLARNLGTKGIARSKSYWNVISMSFMNHARSFSQIGMFNEAGIEIFRWDAVLDEVTTDQCRFMHGKRFKVSSALGTIRKLGRLRNPELIKAVKPWMRVAQDDKGNRNLFFQVGDRKTRVATVTESAVGTKDEVGNFSRTASIPTLERLGASIPPLHGLCRSTVVAEV